MLSIKSFRRYVNPHHTFPPVRQVLDAGANIASHQVQYSVLDRCVYFWAAVWVFILVHVWAGGYGWMGCTEQA